MFLRIFVHTYTHNICFPSVKHIVNNHLHKHLLKNIYLIVLVCAKLFELYVPKKISLKISTILCQ
jgi:hypothetical protein